VVLIQSFTFAVPLSFGGNSPFFLSQPVLQVGGRRGCPLGYGLRRLGSSSSPALVALADIFPGVVEEDAEEANHC
jgi:hypothetical protein